MPRCPPLNLALRTRVDHGNISLEMSSFSSLRVSFCKHGTAGVLSLKSAKNLGAGQRSPCSQRLRKTKGKHPLLREVHVRDKGLISGTVR